MEKKRDTFFLKNKKNQPIKNIKPSNEKNNNSGQEYKNKRQLHFNKNRVGADNDQQDQNRDKPEKKPFDKKAYRLKKYSKKYKLEQWEEQRKKRMMREYQKDLKNDPMAGSFKAIDFDEDVPDANMDVGKFVRHPDLIESVAKKKDPFVKAKEQFQKVKNDKMQRKEEIERTQEERKQKLQEYKKKKHERFKKLSKKTKKGQPVMSGRLELMLEKIQQGNKTQQVGKMEKVQQCLHHIAQSP